MKALRQLSIILVVFMGMWTGSAFAQNASSKTTVMPLDKIVAVLNNDVITQSQLDRQMAMVRQQMQSAGAPLPNQTAFRAQVLNQMINQKLMLMVAERNNIKVTDAQLDKAISGIAARNHMTMQQLQTDVGKQGMTYSQFRKQIHDQMLISAVQQGVIGGKVRITDQQVQAFLKQQSGGSGNSVYQVQDLLVPVSSSAPAAEVQQAEQKAANLYAQTQKTNNFSTVMQNAAQQGLVANDLGWRALSDLPKIFGERVVQMQVGQVAGPIKAPNGFHIIMLEGKKNTGGPTMTADQARAILFQRAAEEKLKPWLAEMRKSAYVKIMQ